MTKKKELTASLEDYLETILQLTRERPVARIRDIAKIRDVKSGSVSPAMKRLESLGLVKYERNEYIILTADGEREAQKVLSRHMMLTNFFEEVINLDQEVAEEEACKMEHHLSDTAMDGLVRFLEFLRTCPGEASQFMEKFRSCKRLNGSLSPGEVCKSPGCGEHFLKRSTSTIAQLKPGESGTVMHVGAAAAIRQRLLDMGVLPSVKVKMERKAPGGDPVWIKIDQYQISLRKEEAESVLLEV